MRTGIANLPLHGGKAPRWLFERMTRLAREIVIVIVRDFGPEEVLTRLSDPYWFQAFGCVLGFDWHSSGVTTTVCGAVKEGIMGLEKELGLFVAGGKGARSRKTPSEIESAGGSLSIEPQGLVSASRLSAKVDSAALQDGYQLYHHAFFFTKKGRWAVVQQGMNEVNRYARRYHWIGEAGSGGGPAPLTETKSFVSDPHSAVCCDKKGGVLNMVASEGKKAREVSTRLSWERPEKLVRELHKIKSLDMPARHHTTLDDIHPERLHKIFLSTYERRPDDFKTLLAMEGVGLKTIRALSLISELVYGVKQPVRDPVRFSFAHGGKDGYPYPVDRITYDESVEFLRSALGRARVGNTDRIKAIKRLGGFVKP
jgi:hypothetical protein